VVPVKRYGAERVDAGCARALVLGTRSHTSVAAIISATLAGMRYPRRKNRPLSFACGSPGKAT
jgi:hypothetical protein